MSRIGKIPVALPPNVTVNIDNANNVVVKGPLGQLTQKIDQGIVVKVTGQEISVTRNSDEKKYKALHGLSRALISNMVIGVTQGYKKTLEVIGVGYKISSAGQLLDMTLGYSHNIIFQVPDEVKVKAVSEKGKTPVIHLESADKQLLGIVAAKIRSLRQPEPYKGKGIKYSEEIIRRKAGKAAATTAKL